MTGDPNLFATLSSYEDDTIIFKDGKVFSPIDEDSWLWHKRLGYANFNLISIQQEVSA